MGLTPPWPRFGELNVDFLRPENHYPGNESAPPAPHDWENPMALETGNEFTKSVLKRYEDIPNPRLREVMQAAVKHLHAFVSEVRADRRRVVQGDPVPDRHRPQVRRQAPGVHPAVGHARRLHAGRRHQQPPRRRRDALDGRGAVPHCELAGDRRRRRHGEGRARHSVLRHRQGRGLDGKPIAGAMLDLWQTDGEGLYEEQRRTAEPWMRGIYHTHADGSLLVRTVAPISYTHSDGRPGRRLLHTPNISHIRPAHIHFAVSAPGYHYLVTHLFQKGDKYIENDVVYGVKEPLVVEFVKKPPGKAPNGETIDTPFYEVNYDFVMEQKQAAARAPARIVQPFSFLFKSKCRVPSAFSG